MAAAQPSTSSSNTSEINVIQEMTDYYQSLVELFAKGVNFDLPGNGGPDCLEYLSETQRIYETILGLTVVVVAFGLGHKLHLDKQMRPKTWTPSTLRSILAVSMSFCIGNVQLYFILIQFCMLDGVANLDQNICHRKVTPVSPFLDELRIFVTKCDQLGQQSKVYKM